MDSCIEKILEHQMEELSNTCSTSGVAVRAL